MHDVIIIGAGAAGIGAGLALLRQQVNFIILEAKDRIGGRAYSESESLGVLWDQGCHWFHSASINPLRSIALKLGHKFTDRPAPYSSQMWRDGAFIGMEGFRAAHDALLQRVAEADVAAHDLPFSSLMDSTSPWHTDLRHVLALTYSQEPESISVADAKAYNDTDENIPVSGGYGRLIEKMAQALPVRLMTPVTAVVTSARKLRVETPHGALEAGQVIVAVPQRVIAQGGIRFAPSLPDDIAEVFEKVEMGWFEKAGFTLAAPLAVAGEGIEILARLRGEDWPVAVLPGEAEHPYVICHIAGHRARDLNEADRLALCEEALAQCFGASLKRKILYRASSRWTQDPFIGGAYSCARPGFAHLRQRLQLPVHERIYFAGEHASLDAMATAHGAYLSGQRAALAALGKTMADGDPTWLPRSCEMNPDGPGSSR